MNYLVFNILLKNIEFIKYWKEIVIYSLFIVILIRKLKKGKISKLKPHELAIILTSLIMLLQIIKSPNSVASIYTARLYIMPWIVYYCGRETILEKKDFYNLVRVMFYTTVIISLYGIFQAYVLGDSFLISLNYKGDSGRLSSGFYISGYRHIQRVTSTFAAPNLCAMYLSFLTIFFVAFKNKININRIIFYIGLFIIIITIILTFSRSAWIGLILAFLYLYKDVIFNSKKFIKAIAATIITVLIAYFVDTVFFNDSIFNNVQLIFEKTSSMEDSSLTAHFTSLVQGINLISENFWGYKYFGYAGVRTYNGILNYGVESSIILLGLDIGLIGMLLWTFTYVLIPFGKSPLGNKIKKYQIGMLIAIFVSLASLPLVRELEVISIVYSMHSFLFNKNIFDDPCYEL